MTVDRYLVDRFAGVARAILPDDDLRQARANGAVIRPDATVDPEALASALSVPIYLDIAGALPEANDIGPRRRVVQAVTVWQLRADVTTAPTTTECTLWLTADGNRIAVVTIQPGEPGGVSPVSVDLDPGALLTIDCTLASGAADASVTIATRPRGR